MTLKTATIDGIEYDLVPKQTCDLKPVHAGYHPVTGRAFQCADRDLPKPMTYLETEKYIAEHCHGWRLPTIEELHVLYANRESIGGFTTECGSGFAHWYWSCTELRVDSSRVYVVGFTGGRGVWDPKDLRSLSSRLLRAELPA